MSTLSITPFAVILDKLSPELLVRASPALGGGEGDGDGTLGVGIGDESEKADPSVNGSFEVSATAGLFGFGGSGFVTLVEAPEFDVSGDPALLDLGGVCEGGLGGADPTSGEPGLRLGNTFCPSKRYSWIL